MAGRNVSDIPPMCMAQKPSFPLESQPPATTTAAEKIKLKTQQVYISSTYGGDTLPLKLFVKQKNIMYPP